MSERIVLQLHLTLFKVTLLCVKSGLVKSKQGTNEIADQKEEEEKVK